MTVRARSAAQVATDGGPPHQPARGRVVRRGPPMPGSLFSRIADLMRGGSVNATWASNSRRLTSVIYREETGFVSLCPELDIASQGDSIEAARDNLREALKLFFECAPHA